MKKALSSLMALALILTIIQVGIISVSALQDGDYTYTLSGSNATVTGYTGAGGNITIPGTLGGYTVTAIGTSAFAYKTSITGLTIPSSVTSIGSYAFRGCTGLTSFTIPSSVTAINTYTFQDCTGLTGVTIPSTVTSIGSYAFQGCTSLAGVDIPTSVTSLGTYVFRYCSGLVSVTIPDGISNIPIGTFFNCTGLTCVIIKNNISTISSYAFRGCSSLVNVTIPGSVTNIGSSAFAYCTLLAGAYFLGNAPGTMGSGVFASCAAGFTVYYISGSTGFTNPWNGYPTATFVHLATPTLAASTYSPTEGNVTVTITYPADATTKEYKLSAGNWTAYTAPVVLTANDTVSARCKDVSDNSSSTGSLVVSNIAIDDLLYTINGSNATITGYIGDGGSITIPSTLNGHPVIRIDDEAFYNNDQLTGLTILNGLLSIGEEAFRNCSELASITMPSSVTSIEDGAFWDCASLTSVEFVGDGLLSIGEDAFSSCESLTDFDIPDSVTSIGTSAFFNCTGLTSVAIPSGLVSIGQFVFYGCSVPTSVTLPSTVTSIAAGAFTGCVGLTEINVNASNPNYSSQDGVLFNKNKTTLIGYPCAKMGSYNVPSSVTVIADAAFWGCGYMSGITIPYGVLSIGVLSFAECSFLTSVTIPATVSSIGENAFSSCTGLNIVYIGDGLTSIGSNAFYHCSSLTDAYFYGNAPTTMYNNVFMNCASGFTVHYDTSKTGFTNPWYGYTTAVFVPSLAPTLSASTTAPTSSDVTVTISFPAAATVREYKIGATGTWTAYTTPIVLPADDIVFARGSDTNSNKSEIKMITVYNIVKLVARDGSSTVIDQNDHFIFGLEEHITQSNFEENYVEIIGFGYLVYTKISGSFGTGTKVELKDYLTDTVVETYYIVIFGDVNGDGNIDSNDAQIIYDLDAMVISWDTVTEAYNYKAGDINLDDNVDSTDADLILDYENALGDIDQETGLYTAY